MDPETNPKTEQQQNLCKQGCGFYGSPPFEGMCSKCFSDYQKRTNPDTNKSPPLSTSFSNKSSLLNTSDQLTLTAASFQNVLDSNNTTVTNTNSITIKQSEAASYNESLISNISQNSLSSNVSSQTTSVAKNKCFKCNKKIGLTGFECRCGNFFCGLHRYSDQHQCDFDYKSAAKEHLSKSNPTINASKINKI